MAKNKITRNSNSREFNCLARIHHRRYQHFLATEWAESKYAVHFLTSGAIKRGFPELTAWQRHSIKTAAQATVQAACQL